MTQPAEIQATAENARITLTLPFPAAVKLVDLLDAAHAWNDDTAAEIRQALYRHLHDPECEITIRCWQCLGRGCDVCEQVGTVACTGCY